MNGCEGSQRLSIERIRHLPRGGCTKKKEKKWEGEKIIKLNASLYCSLSSSLKHFSLTALVLCFCASSLSECPCPCLPPSQDTVTGGVSGAGQV